MKTFLILFSLLTLISCMEFKQIDSNYSGDFEIVRDHYKVKNESFIKITVTNIGNKEPKVWALIGEVQRGNDYSCYQNNVLSKVSTFGQVFMIENPKTGADRLFKLKQKKIFICKIIPIGNQITNQNTITNLSFI